MATDPYASIRTLPFEFNGYDPDGSGTVMTPEGLKIAGWALPVNYDLGQYQSQHNFVEYLPDGRIRTIVQNPGQGKHYTLDVFYRQDLATGQWVMDGQPQESRQLSSGETWRDLTEYTGKNLLTAAAAAAGAYGLAAGGSALMGSGAAPAGATAEGIAGGAISGGAAGGGVGAAGSTGYGLGAAAGGAAGAGLSSADKGAMYGDAGYGSGMSGNATSAYDAGVKTAGGGGMSNSGGGSSLADFFSGNGSASDYGRAAQALYSLYAQNKAADAAAGGQAQANALMREMWQANRADNQPLVDLRNSTLPKINALLSNPSSITQDPGYQFGLKEGENRISNQAAAQGGYYSGNTLKALNRYGQDYASTKLNDSLNRLMGVAGMGQVASAQNQQANNNLASGLGQGLVNSGNIRGSGYMGQANTVNNAMNNWFSDRWLDQYGRDPG